MSSAINVGEMKPCPSCKGNHIFCERNCDPVSKYFVLCNDCGFEGNEFVVRATAVSSWNARNSNYIYKKN